MSDTGRKRIKRLTGEELRARLRMAERVKTQAQEIIETAQKEAALIIQDAKNKRDQEHRTLTSLSNDVLKTYIDEDKIRRHAEVFVEMLSVVQAIKTDHEALKPWLIQLVDTCVRKIIGDLDEPDLIRRTVETALKKMPGDGSFKLYFHPTMAEETETALKIHCKELAAISAGAPDPNLEPGQLRLEGQHAEAEISIEAQLEKIVETLAQVAIPSEHK